MFDVFLVRNALSVSVNDDHHTRNVKRDTGISQTSQFTTWWFQHMLHLWPCVCTHQNYQSIIGISALNNKAERENETHASNNETVNTPWWMGCKWHRQCRIWFSVHPVPPIRSRAQVESQRWLNMGAVSTVVYRIWRHVCFSRFLSQPTTNTHTYTQQGYDITISVPNKSTVQLYTEWLSSFGYNDSGSGDSRSVSFLRVRSGQFLSRALQPIKTSQDRFVPMYSYTQSGTKGTVGSTYSIKAHTVGEEKIVELVPNLCITSKFFNIVTEDACARVCADINGPHCWTTKITFTDAPLKVGSGSVVNVRTTMEPAGCIQFAGKNVPCAMLLPPCFLFGCAVIFCAPILCADCSNQYDRFRLMANREINAVRALLLHGFTNPPNAPPLDAAMICMMAMLSNTSRMDRMRYMNAHQQRSLPTATATLIPLSSSNATTTTTTNMVVPEPDEAPDPNE